MRRILITTPLCALLAVGSLFAQDAARGHWSGAIAIPDRTMSVEVDLDKTTKGWIGSVSIPEGKAKGLPLDAVACENSKCSFRIKGAPGDPTFNGAISEDGKTLAGDFTQGPASFPFKLTRTGDPKVEVLKASPAVAKEFVGNWEGTLEAGQSLRLVLKMVNGEGGSTAVLISVDQGGAEIAVSAIRQEGQKLTLEVKMISGEYQAEINKEGTELNGTWTQGGGSFPLKLKKTKS